MTEFRSARAESLPAGVGVCVSVIFILAKETKNVAPCSATFYHFY
jgi:hypothetical protein